jgi:hypothetical protein
VYVVKARQLIRPLGLALTAAQVALAVREHWGEIPVDRRHRLAALVRQSKGNPKRLSPPERAEAKELVRGLELGRLARHSARIAAVGRRRARRSG